MLHLMRALVVYWLMMALHLNAAPAPCDYSIKGRVIDEHDFSPLDYSTIFVLELSKGVMSDSLGYFELKGICPGTYTFRISHLGCESLDTLITVSYPISFLNFYLEHHAEELAAVQITAGLRQQVNATDIAQSVKISDLRNPALELGQLLKTITGVQNLQTGPSIFKPLIHGLHSDRVLIVNNGVRLEGQSWGAEHAPEMDASAAGSLSVIKGAGSVQYGTDAIGGVVVMDYDLPSFDGSWKGQVNSSFQTNNLGSALHARLGKGFNVGRKNQYAFQAGGTFKRMGDSRAPDYVLSNTGVKEWGGFSAFYFQRKVNEKVIQWQTIYSLYDRTTGILAASHVGNLSDLEAAIESGQPFIIRDRTFEVGLPRQTITHHSLKNQLHIRQNNGSLRLQYDIQKDIRREFDNRRGGRSEIPALDMELLAHHVGIQYKKTLNQHEFSSGIDYYYKYNRNIPGTGFRVIVPDFVSNLGAIWLLDKWNVKENLILEAGGRYEFQHFAVFRFNERKELLKPVFKYHNYAALAGIAWNINQKLSWKSTLGIASRSPNANELFSQGVHQSAAAIEYGDSSLLPERSFKWIHQLQFKWNYQTRLTISPYVNYVDRFIYLEPQNELELTIRGAFPVFKYKQADVLISGIDVDFNVHPGLDWLNLGTRYSFIRMIRMDGNGDLVNTPPNRITLFAALEKDSWKSLSNLHMGIEWMYVSRQERVDINADFAPPPSAYDLLSLELHAEKMLKNHRLGAGVTIHNLLNRQYRDYLDRFRYFADAQGINAHLKLYFII